MRAPSEAWMRWAPWLVALVAVLAWLPPLGLHDYWFPDEPDVALPVLEMLARGDWIVPTANGQPWLDYPPLTYWGGIFWSQFLGSTAFALRLTPLLGGAVFLLSTASIARRVAGPTAAWQAALLAVATPLVWMMATTLQVDMPFAGAQAAGFALYLAGDARQGARAWLLRAAAFACFGLAILAKGPLGLLLPGFILTLWHAWNREWLRIVSLAPLALVSLAVAALWYAPLVQRLGADYVGHELWLQNFDRFGTTTRGHGGKGPFYYLTGLWGDLGPWTLLLPPALWYAWRQRAQRGLRLLGLWFVVSFVFLSLASTKRTVYLLPAYPAILALTGCWIAAQRESRWLRNSLVIVAGFFALAAVALAAWSWSPLAAMPRVAPILAALHLPSVALAVLFAGGAAAVGLAVRRGELTQALRAAAAALLLVFTAALWLVMPVVDRVHSYHSPAAWVSARSLGDGPIGFFYPGMEARKRAGWLCYLQGRRLEFLADAESARAWLQAAPGRVIVTDPKNAPPVPGSRVVNAWTIGEQDWAVLAAGDVAPE